MVQEKHNWIIEELKDLRKKGLISKPRRRTGKGYANFPIKWSIEGNFKDYGVVENGERYNAFMSYSNESFGGIILIDNELRDRVKKRLVNKVLEDANYVKYRKAMHDYYGKALFEFCKYQLSEESVLNASNERLWQLYNTFREIYTAFEFYNGIWFIVSDDIANEITFRLSKLGCTSLEDIELLMTCPHQSFVNRERIAVLECALKIVLDNNSLTNLKSGDFVSFIKTSGYKIVEKLVAEFHWMPFGHVGPDIYDAKHYFDSLREVVLSGEDIECELDKSKKFYGEIRARQEELIRKYSIDWNTQRLLNDLYLFSLMQDERKEFISKTHIYWINNLMKKIGSLFGLDGKDAADLYPDKIEKALLKGEIDLKDYRDEQENHRRIELVEWDGYSYYFGDETKPFLDLILAKVDAEELSGMSACRGKVRGIAKVLRDSNDGHKMNQGDILITTMTTPDFVPYMRKACAIVTDEGGVTCHAAIVSRELGIPCIVGTKHATEVFRDGDFVEVDANTGKVKKIEKLNE